MKMRSNKLLFLLSLLVCLPFMQGLQAQGMMKTDGRETSQKFAAALFYIENFYVDSLKAPELVEDAIINMLKELDPHSAYISKEELDEANEPLEGSFEGIGVTFQLFNDTILVIAPVPGGPSEKLGIMAGDKILKIDGIDSFGSKINNNFVMEHLRGKKGTSVNVSIFRTNHKELIDYTIVRDKIPINSIDATYMADKNTAYIKLNRFAKTTMEEFHLSLNQLRQQGMKNLILDLRGNTGGLLNAAVELSDEFLDEGKLIVYTEGLRSPRQDFKATTTGDFEKGNLIVLINEGSASASEIVSGAIQDWDRGIVIGRRSFGKGLVQRPFQLPDGSIIRLTASRYYTPTGRCIQKSYENGTESYYKDLYERQKHGELMHADSIHFPDSLKYYTPAHRVVFGGGGIMPDVFVPFDSTQYTELYSDLVRKGIFNTYTLEYANRYRITLQTDFPEFAKYNKEFALSDQEMIDFKELALKEGVKWNDAQYELSSAFVQIQLKALIARNIWDLSKYYEVLTGVDETLQEALKILNNRNSYTQLISAK